MGRRKKTDIETDFKYSKSESFVNLEAVQKMALNKKGKDDEIAPDISLYLKAEELKGKLCGLYSDKDTFTSKINRMGSVKIDGKELKPRLGDDINTVKQHD